VWAIACTIAWEVPMNGTMMDVPLTIDRIVDRAAEVMASVEVVSRRPDKNLHRSTLGEVVARGRRLARALVGAGVQRGDRVATLMWNHAAHVEAYLGVPLAGAVVHTLNLRLHPDEIAFIAGDAEDRILIVDDVLLPLLEQFRARAPFERVIVVGRDYDSFLDGAPDVALPTLREQDALGMCYSSGTTGRPKGVVYTHRSTLLHSLATALPDALALSRADTLLPVVPMFHVNAWGLPYAAALVGAKLVLPGPYLDGESLLDLMERERVTIAAGVPTIWMSVREALDAHPERWRLMPGARMVVGGSAVPEQLIRDFDRQGLTLLHAWGMTETSPVGLVSRLTPELAALDDDERYRLRAKQGRAQPLVDVRVCNEAGVVPADGQTVGELQVRGPWIAGSYFKRDEGERWTGDGFFRTGDVANVDRHGFVQLTDRLADLIKSGGEWIASVALENALMGHPAVREAAVVGAPHPKWGERPIAAIVLKPGCVAAPEELRTFLAPKFAKFWLPDAFVVVDAIPRTSAGKFKKSELRARFKDWSW
jgi:fatty-acyl-CoA synthase